MADQPGQYTEVDRATYGIPSAISNNSRGDGVATCYVTFECPKCRHKDVLDAYRGAPKCYGAPPPGKSHPETIMTPIALFRGKND